MPNIEFIKVTSSTSVIKYITEVITQYLNSNGKVFWLVAGGSAIDLAVKIAHNLNTAPNLDLLSITLTDERYGPAGHSDSNWEQLIETGFQLKGANLLRVLNNSDFESTAKNYAKILNNNIQGTDYSIALAGMGPDGHIFGIKPHSPSVEATEDVIAYKWNDYDRITPTFRLLKRLDEVVIYAAGAAKHPQFDNLYIDLSAHEQPAQLLKQLKKVTIFNDYKEGKL